MTNPIEGAAIQARLSSIPPPARAAIVGAYLANLVIDQAAAHERRERVAAAARQLGLAVDESRLRLDGFLRAASQIGLELTSWQRGFVRAFLLHGTKISITVPTMRARYHLNELWSIPFVWTNPVQSIAGGRGPAYRRRQLARRRHR